jgi:hypothetical protein
MFGRPGPAGVGMRAEIALVKRMEDTGLLDPDPPG